MNNEEKKDEKKIEKKNKPHASFMQLTTFRRFGVLILTFLIAYLPTNVLPLQTKIRSIIILVLLVVWTFFEIASLRLGRARRLVQKGKKEAGWKLFKSIAKNSIVPLSSDEKLFLGTVFIQHSDEPQVGIDYLEKCLSKTKNEYNRIRITNSLSLGYFRIGNTNKAIELSKDLYEKGFDDVGLLVNYSTFLLANGDYGKAFDVIEKGGNNIYILDNLGVYYLVNDMHKDAIKLYREILDNMQPRFVEFYIHAFLSELYYNCKGNARNLLNMALSCPRIMTSPYTKEYIERLQKDMENSSGETKINAATVEVAFGREWANTTKTFTPPSKEDVEYFHRDPYKDIDVEDGSNQDTNDESIDAEEKENSDVQEEKDIKEENDKIENEETTESVVIGQIDDKNEN